MFGKKKKTLYEMLGVGRDATLPEIESAYQRRRAEMRGPDMWIHPLIAAKVKVAYETLRDPLEREAYDRKLRSAAPPQEATQRAPEPPADAATSPSASPPQADDAPLADLPADAPAVARPRRRRLGRSGWWGFGLGMGSVLVAGAGAVAYFFLDGPPVQADKEYTGAEIAERVSPHLGRLSGALVGGTRDLGLALATAEDEMVVPCREMPAAMVLTLQVGTASPRAELVRAREDLGLCVIAVRGAAPELTLRTAAPAPGEALYAIVREAGGPPLPLRVRADARLPNRRQRRCRSTRRRRCPTGRRSSMRKRGWSGWWPCRTDSARASWPRWGPHASPTHAAETRRQAGNARAARAPSPVARPSRCRRRGRSPPPPRPARRACRAGRPRPRGS